MNVAGKVVIVTSAGSGIGRAIALQCTGRGARVVCSGRRAERLEETVARIARAGGEGMPGRADVTVREDVDRLVRTTAERYGGLDVLVNNAGSFAAIGGSWEVDPEARWRDVTVNLRGPMLTSVASRGRGP